MFDVAYAPDGSNDPSESGPAAIWDQRTDIANAPGSAWVQPSFKTNGVHGKNSSHVVADASSGASLIDQTIESGDESTAIVCTYNGTPHCLRGFQTKADFFDVSGLPCESTLKANTTHTAWYYQATQHFTWGMNTALSVGSPARGPSCTPPCKDELNPDSCPPAPGTERDGTTYDEAMPTSTTVTTTTYCNVTDWYESYDGGATWQYRETVTNYCWEEKS
jgi:hypothetical protein